MTYGAFFSISIAPVLISQNRCSENLSMTSALFIVIVSYCKHSENFPVCHKGIQPDLQHFIVTLQQIYNPAPVIADRLQICRNRMPTVHCLFSPDQCLHMPEVYDAGITSGSLYPLDFIRCRFETVVLPPQRFFMPIHRKSHRFYIYIWMSFQ